MCGEIILIVVLGVTLGVLLTIQLEIYRRNNQQFNNVKERYLLMDITDVIKSRRSIRKFLDKPIKQGDLNKILNAARMAPSAGNMQPWHFIVIQDRETINQMENTI